MNFLRLLPRCLGVGLFVAAIGLVCLSFVMRLSQGQTRLDALRAEALLFFVDAEVNLPAWFSGCLLFMASQLFLIIGFYRWQHHAQDGMQWILMGLLFLYLSADEVAAIHERLMIPVQSILRPGGLLYWSWVIPVVIVLVAVVIYFRPFVMTMPERIRQWFLGAVTIFLTGSLILEMVGGSVYEKTRNDFSLVYQLAAHTEELLEMTAVIMVIYVLLKEVVLLIPGVDNHYESALKLPEE